VLALLLVCGGIWLVTAESSSAQRGQLESP
jgi:hypothetical protein